MGNFHGFCEIQFVRRIFFITLTDESASLMSITARVEGHDEN